MKVYAFLLFVSLQAVATERDFWGTKLIVNSPEKSFSELCREYREIYQFFSRLVQPPEILVTCFVNPEELEAGEKTIIYKLSTSKLFLPEIYDKTEFNPIKKQYVEDLLAFDTAKEKEVAGALNDTIGDIDARLENIQRQPWKLSVDEDQYAILHTSSEFSGTVEGKDVARHQVVVSGILLLNGKIVFIRVSNSKHPQVENSVQLAKKWIEKLLTDNK